LPSRFSAAPSPTFARRHSGFCLGLAIVKSITEAHANPHPHPPRWACRRSLVHGATTRRSNLTMTYDDQGYFVPTRRHGPIRRLRPKPARRESSDRPAPTLRFSITSTAGPCARSRPEHTLLRMSTSSLRYCPRHTSLTERLVPSSDFRFVLPQSQIALHVRRATEGGPSVRAGESFPPWQVDALLYLLLGPLPYDLVDVRSPRGDLS